jgi:hypothetical protein
LIGIELGNHSLSQSRLSDPDRLLPGLERTPRNVELHVELQQLKVSLRDTTHQLQHNRAPILLP